jgi:hypothetical protein
MRLPCPFSRPRRLPPPDRANNERANGSRDVKGLSGNLRWTNRSLSGPRRLNTRRLVGVTRIAAWIEPTVSLPEPPTKHRDDRAPLRPQADEQSLDLDGQVRASERSQAPRGLLQRLRRRRTMLATNQVRSRLRRIAADDLGTALTLCSPQTQWLIVQNAAADAFVPRLGR